MKNEFIAYTTRVAEWLINSGFVVIRTQQDAHNPRYYNWVFEDSAELRNAYFNYCKQVPMKH